MKKDLIQNVRYNRLKENNQFFSQNAPGRTIKIFDPLNLEKMIEVNRNHDVIKKYKVQNDILLNQFEQRLDKLNQEKLRLQNKIF